MEGELDPMIPGKKIQAIFGFCDIRNFTDATEVLETEVMIFVNEIANIVHGQVVKHLGSANKNIGDAFLLVWKMNPRQRIPYTWNHLADMALISFLKIVVEINRSKELQRYSSTETEYGRKLNEILPGYEVKMGFGLHIGWAIEGAVGSDQKIDATYLSPHVNLAARLESATKLYGAMMLLSGDFHEHLSKEARRCTRKVDVVIVKGSHKPMALFTFDCFTKDLVSKLQSIRLQGLPEHAENEEDRRISIIGGTPIINHARHRAKHDESFFKTDLEIRALQWEIPPHFLPLFRKAVATYLLGKWKEAKRILEVTSTMIQDEEDGPSGTLLKFMEKHNFEAPADWKGYRKLTEK